MERELRAPFSNTHELPKISSTIEINLLRTPSPLGRRLG